VKLTVKSDLKTRLRNVANILFYYDSEH